MNKWCVTKNKITLSEEEMMLTSMCGKVVLHPHPIQFVYSHSFSDVTSKKNNHFKPKCYGGIIRYKTTNGYSYLIVKGRQTGKWSFPKGHSKRGESPLECAYREIGEETGVTSLPEPNKYIKCASSHYYVFDVMTKYEINPKDNNEICEARWATIEEMSNLLLNAGIQQYIKRVKHSLRNRDK